MLAIIGFLLILANKAFEYVRRRFAEHSERVRKEKAQLKAEKKKSKSK